MSSGEEKNTICALVREKEIIVRKTFILKLMSLILLLCLIVSYGAEIGSGTIQALGDTKTDLEAEKSEAEKTQKEIDNTKAEIASIKEKSTSTEQYIAELDKKISDVDGKIYTLNNQIAQQEAKIEDTQKELEAAEAEEASQWEMMKLRIKFMYEHNEEGYLALLISSKSLGEMLNRAEYISKISSYDRKMLIKYQAAVDYVAQVKNELETELAQLEENKTSLQVTRAALEVVQQEKEKEFEAYQTQLASLGKLESTLEAKKQQQEDKIKKMEEEIKQQEAGGSSGPVISEGSMLWPTISRRITSRYGYRKDPATGLTKHHNGVDIGAVKPGVWGDPIYAAESGTVTNTTPDDVGGNWIWIYHGNGLYTVYMHCSKQLVKVGDKVKRGDTIGLMGSTGYSTAAHLHFAVRLNGEYVNPEPYIGIK